MLTQAALSSSHRDPWQPASLLPDPDPLPFLSSLRLAFCLPEIHYLGPNSDSSEFPGLFLIHTLPNQCLALEYLGHHLSRELPSQVEGHFGLRDVTFLRSVSLSSSLCAHKTTELPKPAWGWQSLGHLSLPSRDTLSLAFLLYPLIHTPSPSGFSSDVTPAGRLPNYTSPSSYIPLVLSSESRELNPPSTKFSAPDQGSHRQGGLSSGGPSCQPPSHPTALPRQREEVRQKRYRRLKSRSSATYTLRVT